MWMIKDESFNTLDDSATTEAQAIKIAIDLHNACPIANRRQTMLICDSSFDVIAIVRFGKVYRLMEV